MGDKATKPRSFRMGDEMWARLQQAARDEGVSASDWISSRLELFLSDDPDALPLTNRQMQKVARAVMITANMTMKDYDARHGADARKREMTTARKALEEAR